MITITTDGSCHQSERCGAWAAVVVIQEPGKDPYSYRVNGIERTNSSYRMEIAAVVGALDSLPDNYPGRVRIVTDHSGLAQLINRHVPRANRNNDCHDLLLRLRDHTMAMRVSAEWIKGGSEGTHSFVDKLSKENSAQLRDALV